MLKKLKDNLCFILFGVLFIFVISILVNSIIDGVDRVVTQKMIDETYIINK